MLSSSPAAPSTTGTHLSDNVKTFGSIEADGTNPDAVTRRTSTLANVTSPSAPLKKLDVHALFQKQPNLNNGLSQGNGVSPPMNDRRQSQAYPSHFMPQMRPQGPGMQGPGPQGPPRSPISNSPQFTPQVQQGFRPPMQNGQQVRPIRPMQSQYPMHPGQMYPMGYPQQLPGYFVRT
jgi:translation initiation factor 4G